MTKTLNLIFDKQKRSENSLMVLFDHRDILTEKTKGYLILTKSLHMREFNQIIGYVCDAIIIINDVALEKRDPLLNWNYLHQIHCFSTLLPNN